MPHANVKKWAKEADVSVEKAELAWEAAKKQADKDKQFKTKDAHYWAFVNVSTRMRLGLEGKQRDKEKQAKKDAKAKKKK